MSLYYRTEKYIAGPVKAGYQSCIKLWPTGFLTSLHTTSTAQSGEEPSRHKESHAVAAVFTHKRTITFKGIRLQMLVIQKGTTAWHFMVTTDKNILKIRVLYRNIFPLTGNEKNTSVRAITFLWKTVPNAKDSQNLGTLEIRIFKRKGKFLSCVFRESFK
jgi:hypothetical protein